jgi:hypothetical protein
VFEAVIGFGDQDGVLSRKKPSLRHDCAYSHLIWLLVIGMALAIAGALKTI